MKKDGAEVNNIIRQVSSFADYNLLDWTEATVAEQCRNSAREVGLPDYIVDNIRAVQDNKDVKVIIDYKTPDGLPLGMILNSGRKGFHAEAKGKDNGGADFLHWIDKDTGEDVFAKKVDVPAWDGYRFMERGLILGYPILLDILNDAIQNEVDAL